MILRSMFTMFFLFCITKIYAFEPVDVVYTWVDGSDPKWQRTRSEYLAKDPFFKAQDAISQKRFRDHGELKYSLRSLYMFAPFINHIYIITCGQRPKWLKDHPKITLIDHKAIFKDYSHLPSYNSMAIECHLHRIPGLSEHYIYFNDDFFLGKKASFTTFFTKSGKVKVFLSKHTLPFGSPRPGEEGYRAAMKNTMELLHSRYNKKVLYAHAHTPYSSTISLATKTESKFPEVFSKVSSHHFRSLQDYLITNGLIPFFALEHGLGEKAYISNKTCSYGKNYQEDSELLHYLSQNCPQVFCIQDSSEDPNPESERILKTFFDTYFPLIPPWEQADTEGSTLDNPSDEDDEFLDEDEQEEVTPSDYIDEDDDEY